jgi:hypothetical protein
MAETSQGIGLEVLSSIKGSLCSAAAQTALHLNLFGAGAACAADSTRAVQLDIAADMSSEEMLWPVALSLLAGLSTSIGGIIAVALTPGEATLAFMLGTGKCKQQQQQHKLNFDSLSLLTNYSKSSWQHHLYPGNQVLCIMLQSGVHSRISVQS